MAGLYDALKGAGISNSWDPQVQSVAQTASKGDSGAGKQVLGAQPPPPPVQTSRVQPQNTWSLQGGFDMSGPGAAEDAYAQYGQQLAKPGATEQFAANRNGMYDAQHGTAADQYTQRYNPMGEQSQVQTYAAQNPMTGPSATQQYNQAGGVGQAQNATAAGQYWNSLQGQSNVPKDMSSYYDRQYDRGASRLNDQFAARGMYGSSAAMDQLSQFGSDLGAQQAKDEAAYGLQSAQLNNNIMSGAASAADASGVGRYNAGLAGAQGADATGTNRYLAGLTGAQGASNDYVNRYNAGLSGAQSADQSGLGRYNAGLNAAQGSDASLTGRLGVLGNGAMAADTSRQGRVGGVFDNLTGLTNNVNQTVGAGYGSLLGTDQGMMDMGQQMSLGAGLANLTGVQNQSALNVQAAQGVGQTFQGAGQDAQNLATQLQKKKAT